MREAAKYPRRRTRRFVRTDTFVAVKPIRLRRFSTIDVGERVPAEYVRRHHLMKLYRQFRIGAENDAWTQGMLAQWANRYNLPPIAIRDFDPNRIDEEHGKPKPPPPPPPPPPPAQEPERPAVESVVGGHQVTSTGKGWFEIHDANGSVVARLRGKESVDNWIAEKEGAEGLTSETEN